MAKHVDPFRQRLKQDAVRPPLHLDGLDGRQRLGVPHHDRTAAAEAVLRLGVHGDPVGAGVGDGAHRLEAVQVEDQHLVAPGNIEAAVVVVRIDVIDPPVPMVCVVLTTRYGVAVDAVWPNAAVAAAPRAKTIAMLHDLVSFC